MKPHRPEDEYSPCDDTLEEGAAKAPASAAAKQWVMEQRFVHGMLRALQGADSESREARVAAILEAIPRREAGRRFWLGSAAAAAAAVLVASSLWWLGAFQSPPPAELALPKPEQALALAVRKLIEPVDRAYELTLTFSAAPGRSEPFEVYVRAGGCFLLEGIKPNFMRERPDVRYVARSDGQTVSIEYPDLAGAERIGPTEPLADALKKHNLPGNLFGAEHLDFVRFLSDLPNAYDLTTVERVAAKSEGDEPFVRLRATRRDDQKQREEREVVALIGERSGLLQELQIVIEFRGGPGKSPGRGRRGGDHDERAEHAGKPEHPERWNGDRPKPPERMGGRRGGPGEECREHTLTFRYSEDRKLSLSEYAPPK